MIRPRIATFRMTLPRRAIPRLILGIVVALIPLMSTVALLRVRHQAALSDLLPVWVDDVLYWHQAITFSAAGFNGGYYAVSEIPASAAFTHFNTWGPFTPALYGLLARWFGWTLYAIPLVNLLLLTIVLALLLVFVRPGIEQLLLLGAALVVFVPLILYATSSLQEVFQDAVAIALSAVFFCLLKIKEYPSRRWIIAMGVFIAIVSLTRVTWAFLLPPAFVLAETQLTPRRLLVALLKGSLLLVALLGVYVLTSAPFPGVLSNVMTQFRASPQAGLTSLGDNMALNLSRIGQGDDLEIRMRQIIGVLAVACVGCIGIGLARWKKAAPETRTYLKLYSLCLLVLGTISLFVIMIYDMKDWRDFRLFAPPLLLVLTLLILFKRRLLAALVLVVLALQVPYALNIYDIWTGYHLDAPKRQQFVDWQEPLKTALAYNPDAPNPWCNTVLHSAYYIFGPTSVLLAVDPGIGLSSPLLEGQYRFPPKSRYLMLDTDTYTNLAAKLHVEPLLDIPGGKLYRNLDAPCPP